MGVVKRKQRPQFYGVAIKVFGHTSMHKAIFVKVENKIRAVSDVNLVYTVFRNTCSIAAWHFFSVSFPLGKKARILS